MYVRIYIRYDFFFFFVFFTLLRVSSRRTVKHAPHGVHGGFRVCRWRFWRNAIEFEVSLYFLATSAAALAAISGPLCTRYSDENRANPGILFDYFAVSQNRKNYRTIRFFGRRKF